MPEYPKTGSILNSELHTELSTQILITVNNEPVGAIQSFQETQNRPSRRITEVGTDGTIEITPQSAATVTLNVNRVAFDGLSIAEAFSRGFVNIKSQRIAFDIVVINHHTGTGDDAVITTYHNCWFTNMGKTYSATDYVVIQTATIEVEDVRTTRANGPVVESQGAGGSRQNPNAQIDAVEGAADSGEYRGTLDFPGLISAAF